MLTRQGVAFLTLAATLLLALGDAAATARTGGVIALIGGAGACNKNQFVPLDTQQDNFALSESTACNGSSASGAMHSSAATASAGLRAAASSGPLPPGSGQTSAQISFMDTWTLGVPTGTPTGTFLIPVSLHLDGVIAPGSVFHPAYGRFIDYGLTVRDSYTFGVPAAILSASGSISATGNFAQTFSGNVAFRYWGPGSLPSLAEVSINLYVPGLIDGALDFYNTASITMDLPSGFTATTSSGIPLIFPAVPEPTTSLLLAAGAALLWGRAKFSRAVSARR